MLWWWAKFLLDEPDVLAAEKRKSLGVCGNSVSRTGSLPLNQCVWNVLHYEQCFRSFAYLELFFLISHSSCVTQVTSVLNYFVESTWILFTLLEIQLPNLSRWCLRRGFFLAFFFFYKLNFFILFFFCICVLCASTHMFGGSLVFFWMGAACCCQVCLCARLRENDLHKKTSLYTYSPSIPHSSIPLCQVSEFRVVVTCL